MTLKGNIKKGFDLKQINQEHIFIEGKTVKIISPIPIVISAELPFDEAKIEKEIQGFGDIDYTEEDRKAIYRKAKEEVLQEIKADKTIQEEARTKSEDALRDFILLLMPEVENIEFIRI